MTAAPAATVSAQDIAAGLCAEPDHEQRQKRGGMVLAFRAPNPQPMRLEFVQLSERGDARWFQCTFSSCGANDVPSSVIALCFGPHPMLIR